MAKSLVPNLEELSVSQLQELDAEFVTLFNEGRAEELTVEKTIELSELAGAIDEVRSESRKRAALAAQHEAAGKQAAQTKIEELAARVAATSSTEEFAEDAPEEAAEVAPVAEVAEAAAEAAEELKVGGNNAPAADTKKTVAKDKTGLESADDDDDNSGVTAAAAPAKSEISLFNVGRSVAQIPTPENLRGHPVIVAAADIPEFSSGSELTSMGDVARALVSRREAISGTSSAGNGERMKVATIKASFSADRMLSAHDAIGNQSKIDAAIGAEALTASGGVCAPGEPYYGLLNLSIADRPVKAALPTFMADRGSIRFIPPPRITDTAGSIGITTAAQDATGYGSGAKQTLHVTCGAEQQVFVSSIHRILVFGNFGARTFPEQVEIWTNLSIAEAARVAEGYLLDQIKAASTQITSPQAFGASRQLLAQIDTAAASLRSRHRMDPRAVLRWLGPQWVINLFRADLARSRSDDPDDVFGITDAQIAAWFAVRNIAPSFHLDSATGGGQIFGTQAAGALLTFPPTVQWALFPEGSFLHLDGGTLDLGLVRDSTLNSTNDYEIFAEVFENIAYVGVESYWVTSTVCASGDSNSGTPGNTVLTCPM